jgi:hypothetical protein
MFVAFQHVHGFCLWLPHNDKGGCKVQCSKIRHTSLANLFTSSISHVLYIVDDWIWLSVIWKQWMVSLFNFHFKYDNAHHCFLDLGLCVTTHYWWWSNDEKLNWFCENKVSFNWKYWLILHEIRIQNLELNWI